MAANSKKGQKKEQVAATSTSPEDKVDETYEDDDWFDIGKYKQAADVAYGYSKKKIEDAGKEERQTIETGGDQQRKTNSQMQQFSEKDEERDYKQSQKGYRF